MITIDHSQFWQCVDCKAPWRSLNEEYMVIRSVWHQAGMKYDHRPGDGLLCIGCLETRLGRELTRADFTDAPINQLEFDVFNRSDRLFDRLCRGL